MKCVDNQWVCVDCLFALANGDYPDDEERAAAVQAGEQREADAGGHWSLDSWHEDDGEEEGDDEKEFSWWPCDCCGSHLGGSRHRAAVIYTRQDAAEDTSP